MRYFYIVGRATYADRHKTIGFTTEAEGLPSLRAMCKELGGSSPIILSWQELTEEDFFSFVSEPVYDLL